MQLASSFYIGTRLIGTRLACFTRLAGSHVEHAILGLYVFNGKNVTTGVNGKARTLNTSETSC